MRHGKGHVCKWGRDGGRGGKTRAGGFREFGTSTLHHGRFKTKYVHNKSEMKTQHTMVELTNGKEEGSEFL